MTLLSKANFMHTSVGATRNCNTNFIKLNNSQWANYLFFLCAISCDLTP